MGRASRSKWTKKAFASGGAPAGKASLALHQPAQQLTLTRLNKVYRFFKDPLHADALVAGIVWLSTLETCRAYEDPLQGDPDEAVQIYNSGYAVGGSNDAAFKLIAERSGILIGSGCHNITLSNNTSIQRLQDAFVFCTTEKFNPKNLNDTFGLYCVEILRPQDFFQLLTAQFAKVHAIHQAAFGRVIYRERSFAGLQNPPGPIGFVKPPDKYKSQHEVRLLWTLASSDQLIPFALCVPECAALCKRIS